MVCHARYGRAQQQRIISMNNKNFIVGMFVTVALVAFVFTSLWLVGKKGTEPTVNYSMFFEKGVGGLGLGGPVFYLGVEVGTVTAMTIIPGNPMQVRVDARVLASAPIDSGTYASLALQGITGVAVVKLSAQAGVFEPLQQDKEPGVLVIDVRDTGFSAIMSKAPEIIDKLDSILVQVDAILGQENRNFITKILSDVSTVTNALAENEAAIKAIPTTLNQAMTELHQSLLLIKSMAGDIKPQLSSTLNNVEQATGDLASMMARLDALTAANERGMNAFMADGLGQVPALITDMRSTMREIEKMVKDLREDPSVLIYKPREETIDVEQ